jgi:hypothetical protein
VSGEAIDMSTRSIRRAALAGVGQGHRTIETG